MAHLELWILRILVVCLGFLGILGLSRERYRKRVTYGDRCPLCGSEEFYRVHRSSMDRILGYGMNVYRFRCKNPECSWEGLRHSDASGRQRKRKSI